MKKIFLILLAGVFWIATTMDEAAGQSREQPAMPTVLIGVYTEEQAVRGQALYYQHCLACHGEMMNGLDQAPPLAGPQFSDIWAGESLSDLVARIGTMPPDKPGKLSRTENVEILTYILWFNDLPLGNVALGIEPEVLAEIIFQVPPPGY